MTLEYGTSNSWLIFFNHITLLTWENKDIIDLIREFFSTSASEFSVCEALYQE